MHKAWIALTVCLLILACAVGADTITQVKASPLWTQVTTEGVVTYIESGECYIESANRTAGMLILGPNEGMSVGDRVTVIGTYALEMGEPAVINASVYPTGSQAEIRPFGMANGALGGDSKLSLTWIWDYAMRRVKLPGYPTKYEWRRVWGPAIGGNNVGLLVTTWGTVKAICETPTTGARWLVIDDGSEVIGDNGDLGVIVHNDADVEMGDRISVTGVSSTDGSIDDPNRLVRAIRTRDVSDVQVVAHRDGPGCPFSDEFDGPTLNPKWLLAPQNMSTAKGSISTTVEPGWLTMSCTGGPVNYVPQAIQFAPGDWQLDMRIRVLLPEFYAGQVGFLVGLNGLAGLGTNLPQTLVAWSRHRYLNGEWENRVWLWGYEYLPMSSDTCFLRIRHELGQVTSGVSFDGANYQTSKAQSCSGDFLVFAFYPAYQQMCLPFTYHIDYVRFSPLVTEGGAQ